MDERRQAKKKVRCPFCLAQGISLDAERQKPSEVTRPENTRYGCDNGHFFAVPTKEVL